MAEDVKSMDRLAILDLIYVLGQSQVCIPACTLL